MVATGPSPGAQRYSYAEITAATNDFEKEIGKGGFGLVHYGRLSNGKEVAIKTLDSKSGQGAHEFTNEVRFDSQIWKPIFYIASYLILRSQIYFISS